MPDPRNFDSLCLGWDPGRGILVDISGDYYRGGFQNSHTETQD